MNKPFIPQALVDEANRCVLKVFTNEAYFNARWKGRFTTVDAPGIETKPQRIRVGDVIDFYITGWNKAEVTKIEFVDHSPEWSDWQKVGTLVFTTKQGLINAYVNGIGYDGLPIYVFPK